jgi:hypothetical protein
VRACTHTHTPLNENVISFAVLKDQANALDVLDKEFERAVPEDLARNSKNTTEISDMIKKFYFADQHVSEATLLQFVNVSMCKPPRRYPYFGVVAGLVWSKDPESYAGSSVCYW